ncbi:MAG: c-type cytochrome [Myxococcales bacterium]|nr:c-type cytochrome [Myxococcales bacterium]
MRTPVSTDPRTTEPRERSPRAFRPTMVLLLFLSASAGILLDASSGHAAEFADYLAAVDQALVKNPNAVPKHALYSCQDRRAFAVRLERRGEDVRAIRSLRFCFNLLGISTAAVDRASAPVDSSARQAAQLEKGREDARREYERALQLEPDPARGLEIYRSCAACHTPEGWGMASGVVPQLAGQHRSVVIKQLADIRAGNRQNRVMLPYASVESIGGAQAIADVAAYIDTLEISVENGHGDGQALALGERLYGEHCARCHGARGEGDAAKQIPRIQSQHYGYLLTQFELIRDGKRLNANPEMTAQIAGFEERETKAVLDWVSRLEPPEELRAPAGWRNPDFASP